MKKIILPKGTILMCQNIGKIEAINENGFMNSFTIKTLVGGDETLWSHDIENLRLKLVEFLDNNETTLNFYNI